MTAWSATDEERFSKRWLNRALSQVSVMTMGSSGNKSLSYCGKPNATVVVTQLPSVVGVVVAKLINMEMRRKPR